MSDGNGNGNHGATTSVRLAKLLAYHEGIAAAIRTTLDALGETRTATKRAQANGTIGKALALDAERRAAKPSKPKPARSWSKGAVKARRRASAALLARLSKSEPKPFPGKGSQPLLRYGYIARKGSGYVRTDKVFEP